jgi:dihydrofolate reductase
MDNMARFIVSMNISLDGYVDHDRFAPNPDLMAYWIDQTLASSGGIYGRRIYDLMRYWEQDDPGWGPPERAFAAAWRSKPIWVASRTLTRVGPNATLLGPDSIADIRALKTRLTGEIDVGGTDLAGQLGALGLIDEYRLCYHPEVLGKGTPFFTAALPRLRITAQDRIADQVVRLTCVPA